MFSFVLRRAQTSWEQVNKQTDPSPLPALGGARNASACFIAPALPHSPCRPPQGRGGTAQRTRPTADNSGRPLRYRRPSRRDGRRAAAEPALGAAQPGRPAVPGRRSLLPPLLPTWRGGDGAGGAPGRTAERIENV